ncbi:SpoIIE family protein phosphatase [bacterium]|nr:SpoIIE family protein phosphatase [bacterium]
MNRTKILKAVYIAIVFYVGATGIYYFVDAFIMKRTPNDQCLWSEEKTDQGKHIVIREILEGGVSDRAGLKDGDILIAINDTLLRSTGHASQILNKARPEDTLIYTVVRNDQKLRLPLQIVMTMNTLYFGFALLGFGFLLVGWMVGTARPGDRVPSLFFKMSMFGALLFILGGAAVGVNYNGSLFWIINVIVGYILFPALFIHFFLVFPNERLSSKTSRWLIPSIYVFSFLNIVYFIVGVIMKANGILSVFIFFSMMGTGFGLFCRSYFKLKDPKQRKPLKSILIGTTLGFSGFLYLLIVPNVGRAVFINYPEALTPVGIVALIPLSFGYSIFRYRTMDIDVIIKKSLVYAATTAGVAVVYLAILLIMGYAVQGIIGGGSQNPYLQFGVLLIAAFVFAPMKERIQTVVDKRFFRERYNYQKALLDFSQELPHLTQLDEILQKVIYTVTSTMHIESMAIALYADHAIKPSNYIQHGIAEAQCDLECCPGGLIEQLAKTKRPQLLDPVNLAELPVPGQEKLTISACKIVLAVPMVKQNSLIGVLLMGPKLSEKPFAQEDMDLLTTVASQAGIAIENARLIKEELEKAKLENELNVARRIQQSLLPARSPEIPGLDIAGVSLPALSVGGDYFDYIKLDDHRFMIAVGDVSGKGVSAALYMSKIQGMIQIASRLYKSPREILIEVNQWMYHGMERQSFVTMIVGVIDLKKRTMTICRAGHNPAIAMHEGMLKLIRCKGLGVGLVPGEMFEKNLEEETTVLDAGNTYIFYTDGVTEAMNDRHDEFGEEHLYELVQMKKDQTSAELLNTIVDEVNTFCYGVEQHDDITVVIVKVK